MTEEQKEKARAYNKRYYEKHREERLAKAKEYHRTSPKYKEYAKKYNKEYRERNKERLRALDKERYYKRKLAAFKKEVK